MGLPIYVVSCGDSSQQSQWDDRHAHSHVIIVSKVNGITDIGKSHMLIVVKKVNGMSDMHILTW